MSSGIPCTPLTCLYNMAGHCGQHSLECARLLHALLAIAGHVGLRRQPSHGAYCSGNTRACAGVKPGVDVTDAVPRAAAHTAALAAQRQHSMETTNSIVNPASIFQGHLPLHAGTVSGGDGSRRSHWRLGRRPCGGPLRQPRAHLRSPIQCQHGSDLLGAAPKGAHWWNSEVNNAGQGHSQI